VQTTRSPGRRLRGSVGASSHSRDIGKAPFSADAISPRRDQAVDLFRDDVLGRVSDERGSENWELLGLRRRNRADFTRLSDDPRCY
jgi:hypothetical protein